MKISIIGSGNIATFFAKKIKQSSHEIVQIISKNISHAKKLADEIGCDYSDTIAALNQDSEVILFAVKDDVLLQYASELHYPDKLIIHTAGSVTLNELKNISPTVACIWCLYSVQKNNLPKENDIPLVINADNESALKQVTEIAHCISTRHFVLQDSQKSVLHLAAVFANNFTNHLYTLSKQLCEQHQIPFDILKPIILETAQKAMNEAPEQNQTGPAVRNDTKTMQKHIELMNDEQLKKIYVLLSESIQNHRK